MSQWYYRHGERTEGPVPTEDILRLLRTGTLGQQTLLWREGLAQWQPLSTLRHELGLGPALPPAPPPPAVATAAARAPARRGLSGCAIAAIVALACLVPVALLAAIAFPAYQQYLNRAVVAQALAEATPVQAQIQQAMAQAPSGSCPSNGQPPFRAPGDYAGATVSSITIGAFPSSGACGLELVLRKPDRARVDGKRVWLQLDGAGHWRCSSELPDTQLPARCRGAGR